MAVANLEVVDLRGINARHLEALLEDEVAEWRRDLDWDFRPSATLVREYAGTNSLGGGALMVDGELVGYGYAVLEEPKGIIGDVYVRPAVRTPKYEAELFRSLLEALSTTPRITRMESQLMLTGADAAAIIRDEGAARGKPVRLFERLLMARGSSLALPAARTEVAARFRLEGWDNRFLHVAGTVIAGSYKGETDSEINAQYRSPAGARRFLSNIVEFPGCGTFHGESSFVAFDRESGSVAGIALSGFVADGVGHVSQLCVMPEARGSGLGYELLRTAVGALYRDGARSVSLTVTASNDAAIALYDKFGFQSVRAFFAYTWEVGARRV